MRKRKEKIWNVECKKRNRMAYARGAFATSVMPDTHARNPLARKRSAWTTVQKEEDGEEARESHKAYAQWRNERRQV